MRILVTLLAAAALTLAAAPAASAGIRVLIDGDRPLNVEIGDVEVVDLNVDLSLFR